MAEADGTNNRDAEIKRLRDELNQTQLRLEEVTSYYRGEIEAVRKRSEDELLQVQADEAARRRRAEEQAAQLNAELRSARSESDKAKRRYQALLDRIENVEAESRAEVRAERDRYEDSARAAWQTAEEEIERLNTEIAELQRKLESERTERQRVEQNKTDMESAYQRHDGERQQLIARLKRALKASENRRAALEREGPPATGAPPAAAGSSAASGGSTAEQKPSAAEIDVQVDPASGWGHFQLGEGDDVAEEFLMVHADQSFSRETSSGGEEGKGPEGAQASEDATMSAHAGETDEEAERLIMGVAVDQKVARRQAEGPAQTAAVSPSATQQGQGPTRKAQSHTPPLPEAEEPTRPRVWPWVVAAALAAGALAGGAVWLGSSVQISIISKSSFSAPHSGQTKVSGMSSHRVPGSMPSSGTPFSSS